VVEVASPSSARYDRTVKRLRYQRARVPDYWVVDLTARAVERWRPESVEAEIVTGPIEWAGHAVDLPAVFARVHGDG